MSDHATGFVSGAAALVQETRPLMFESIDEPLGPAAGRFFGGGHRRVGYRMNDVLIEGEQGVVQAEVQVTYPADWSSKLRDVELRPHLSTIDAMVLATHAAGLLIEQHFGLDQERVRTLRIRRIDIKAGAVPFEEGLERVAVSARLRPAAAGGRMPASQGSTVDCEVGNMTVRCEVEHPPRAPRRQQRRRRMSRDELAGMDALHRAAYQVRSQRIGTLSVDVERLSTEAVVTLGPGTMTMLDSFVVSLQMGQVLLYELDELDRATSDTLWMRNTTISCDGSAAASVSPLVATTALVGSMLLAARGERWRTATIVGECHGVRTRCAIAHRLPDATRSERLS